MLSLSQLVTCGDQSAGKSSVLEALTEIPFPRKDNLCTRFATEIILRHAPTDSLQVRVIPDSERPTTEQEDIKNFNERITEFGELPTLIEKATQVMGLDTSVETDHPHCAFAKDTLSIEIEGPSRPQLTLVDLPGIIQSKTKDTSQQDIGIVSQITDQYIYPNLALSALPLFPLLTTTPIRESLTKPGNLIPMENELLISLPSRIFLQQNQDYKTHSYSWLRMKTYFSNSGGTYSRIERSRNLRILSANATRRRLLFFGTRDSIPYLERHLVSTV